MINCKFCGKDASRPEGEMFIQTYHGIVCSEECKQKINTLKFPATPAAVEAVANREETHPLEIAFTAALRQATKGKGERHGGDSVPFYDQQWTTLADCHGVGFLTGQASKKLNEAAQKTDYADWEREVLGAIVYAGMAILKRRGYPNGNQG